MNKKTKIILFYAAIAVFSIAIFLVANYLRQKGKEIGDKEVAKQMIPIQEVAEINEFVTLTDQDGNELKLSSLRGRVWTVNAFFANCPLCNENNTEHLKKIHDLYKQHPDFLMVSISIDDRDTPQRIKENLSSLEIDFNKWKFLSGDQEIIRPFLEQQLMFLKTEKREGPDAATKGLYAHDMAIVVVDRNMKIRLKRDIYHADNLMPGSTEARTQEVIETIGALLAGNDKRPLGKAEIEFKVGPPDMTTPPAAGQPATPPPASENPL